MPVMCNSQLCDTGLVMSIVPPSPPRCNCTSIVTRVGSVSCCHIATGTRGGHHIIGEHEPLFVAGLQPLPVKAKLTTRLSSVIGLASVEYCAECCLLAAPVSVRRPS